VVGRGPRKKINKNKTKKPVKLNNTLERTEHVHRYNSCSALKCLYLNARSLRNKMPELITLTDALKPDVIGVTENWRNSDILDCEFSIPGYSMFRQDRENGCRGGGVLLLVNSNIGAIEVKLNNGFSEQLWCKIKIRNGENFYIGVCYRSPNPEFSDNDKRLCDMIKEVHGKPVLLMGDFNYPDIEWLTMHGQSQTSQNFANCIDDAFMTQNVTEDTCNGAIVDLIITSEPEMVTSLSVLSALGNSDHNMISWDLLLSTASSLFNRPCLNYAKADFVAIRESLSSTDWDSLFFTVMLMIIGEYFIHC